MFIIWAIIIFIAALAIEYAWFGSFLFVTSTIPVFNLVVASSIMYAIFFGFVFATAQFVLRPQMMGAKPMPSYHAPAKSTIMRSKPKAKKKAKKTRKKKRKR
ncbi:hypothetical protein COU37_03630 [Candidatus Micrarchaeota archaeon CG10_big_fil_rev_8_21_14_0_10_45_29]|nr:MAG: hypothetical protein COU37_03630 [Candidatus Micrarchaeota archaeon CG10_big_fil_rev_8_21_14_0_10_45_29]